MGLFQTENPKEKQHRGLAGAFSADVIKWEPETEAENGIIVHKFEYEDFPNGSYLIVNQAQMAVFVNNLASGDSLDAPDEGTAQLATFIGPCKIKLETGDSRFAPFRNISHAFTGGESAFHSSVYFINTTYMNELNWGTQAPVLVMDPEEEINVHVRAFGLFGAHIEQHDAELSILAARRFLNRVVGTRADFTRDELVGYMRAKILEYVPNLLAESMVEEKIGILKINTKLTEFSERLFGSLKQTFAEFGLTLDNFSFHSINVPDSDLAAINDMKIKRRQMQLEAEGTAAKMDIESEARARMREREGYTYQQEQAYGVMQNAASNEGGAGSFMGAGMGIGMGAGVAGALGAGMGSIAAGTLGAGMGNIAGGSFGSTTQNMGTGAGMEERVAGAATASVAEGVAFGSKAVSMTGKKCAACGSENPANASFCLKCGQKLEESEKCPDCGRELVAGAVFCPYCGRKLGKPGLCPKCGAELLEGAKFCMNCGERI